MLKRLQTYIFTVLFSILCLSVSANNDVKNGILDLRHGKLEQQKIFNLNGEWEFYWKKLLTSSDFIKETHPEKNFYITVPSVWHSYEPDGEKHPRKGYATYRIRVFLDKPEKLAIKLNSIGTAFNAYVDNKCIAKAGIVATNKADAKPYYKTGIVTFTPDSASFDLIFQVSNYHYSKGGLWGSDYRIGLENPVEFHRQKQVYIDYFILGSILIIALYHLGIFVLSPRNRSTLYFSLFCIIYLTRTLFVGEQLVLTLIPNINWSLLIRIEYFTLTGGLLFASLFFYEVFPDNYSKKALYIIGALALLNSLFIFFGPVWIFSLALPGSQAIVLIGAIYISWVIIKGVIKKDIKAILVILGFTILLLTVINDVLYAEKIVNISFMSSYGFMFFILSQAFMLSQYFSYLYKKTNKMAGELRHINTELEKKVDERTLQLSKQNEQLQVAFTQIENSNIELERQNEKIRTTQERLEEQHGIVCKQKNKITDSIHYAERIQRALLPSVDIFREFEDHFLVYHPRNIISGDFYWLERKDKTILFAIADCTGHSVPGAFMSILGMAFLNVLTNSSNNEDTSSILNNLRDKIKKALKQKENVWEQKDGMDISLCKIDLQYMTLQFSGAYQSLYVFRNNEYIRLKGDRQPIAIYRREIPFTAHEMIIEKGDVIYTFSDGFVDQVGGKQKRKFMTKNLLKHLLDIHQKPLNEQKNILEDTLAKWKDDNEQTDDILIAGIRI